MTDALGRHHLAVGMTLLDESADCVVVADAASGEVLHVNPAFAQVVGRTALQLAGRPLPAAGLWVNEAHGHQIAARLARGERIRDTVVLLRTSAGQTVLASLNAAGAVLGGLSCHVHHLRPLPDETQDRCELGAILETALIGIAFNRSHPEPRHFIRCNPVFESMLGWRRGELIGRPTSCIWPSTVAYRAALAAYQATLRRGEAIETECTLMRKDGSTFPCQLRARMVPEGHDRPEGTVMILEDLTRRRAQEAALAAAVQDAVDANLAKSAFVANLSHEIRNPLCAMLGLAHLATARDCGARQRSSYLRQILASALMLKDLLDNTLDFAKIEAGMLTVTERPFDAHGLLAELACAWQLVASGRGLTLQRELDRAAPAWLVGDATRIRQILSNFVSNAIKFSEQGEVRLCYGRSAGGGVLFRVIDQGPGIDKAMQAQLFRRFVQLDGGFNTQKATGSGLGLSICRDLAQRMGGEVGVDSVPGQGACFWLELPLPLADAATARDAAATAAERGATGGALQTLAGARVLLVEDDEVNQMITRTILERWGGAVEVAADGLSAVRSALAAAAAHRGFDIILMDLHMPGLSGTEATREIRRHPQADGSLVIGLSAAAVQQEIDAALAAGMAAVISKPFDPGSLCQRLRLHWNAARSGAAGPAPRVAAVQRTQGS